MTKLIQCACGCGTEFPQFDRRGRARRYVPGHNAYRDSADRPRLIREHRKAWETAGIQHGYCLCGCGQRTKLMKKNHAPRGLIAWEPYKYVHGHNSNGETNPNWKGGETMHPAGYKQILMPDHPRAISTAGYVFEHILIAEKALGKYLPPGAVVHHHSPTQLVICEDQAYHMLLHKRMRDRSQQCVA